MLSVQELQISRGDLAFYGLDVFATVTAVLFALRKRRHAPIAALFAFGLVSDGAMRALARELLGQSRPFTGMVRVAWTIRESFFSAYVPAVVVVVLLVLWPRQAGRLLEVPTLAFAVVVGAHVFLYPALRGEALGAFYRKAHGTLCAVLAVSAIVFEAERRRWRRKLSATELLALWCCGAEVMNLFGPYWGGKPWEEWGLARVDYGIVFAIALITQGRSLWMLRSGRSGRTR